MKKTIYMLLLFVLSNQIYAQNKQNEAIAAYQLAEENFEKGNYQTALDFLESAKKNFGKANSKMLYLQVYIENELYKNEQLSYNDILKTIASFEKAPDIKTFNNDKKLEISKLKLTLANIEKERAKILKEKEEKEKKVDDYAYEGWPFNISFKELQEKNKDSLVFAKRMRSAKNKDLNYDFLYSGSLTQSNYLEHYFKTPHYYYSRPEKMVYGILVRNDKIIGYRRAVLPSLSEDNYKKEDRVKAWEELSKYIEETIIEYNDFFGFESEKNLKYKDLGYVEYFWKKRDKTISLYVKKHKMKNGFWEVSIVEEIKDESVNK